MIVKHADRAARDRRGHVNEGFDLAFAAKRPDPRHDDERRRYYALTRLGRRVAAAEARRLERLLADARATGLLPRRG